MKAYLDTSVMVSRLLNQSNRLRRWGDWEAGYASTLVRTEFHRTIDRLRLAGQLTDLERAAVTETLDPDSKPIAGEKNNPTQAAIWLREYSAPNGKRGAALTSTMGSRRSRPLSRRS